MHSKELPRGARGCVVITKGVQRALLCHLALHPRRCRSARSYPTQPADCPARMLGQDSDPGHTPDEGTRASSRLLRIRVPGYNR